MGLFNFLKKKKKLPKSEASREDIEKGVKAIRKIMNAQNDKDFIEGMLDLPGKSNKSSEKQNNLTFKSVDASFEYMEKFFGNAPLEKKGLYHGKILQIDKTGTAAFIKVLCLINGQTDYAIISAEKGEECNSKLKKGDMVYVGMESINKTIDNRVRRWEKDMKEKDYPGKDLHPNSFGTIVKKLKLELNVSTNQFEIDE